jgi:hypothetical protein
VPGRTGVAASVGQTAALAANFLDDFEDNNVTDGNPVWVEDLGSSGILRNLQASGGNYHRPERLSTNDQLR